MCGQAERNVGVTGIWLQTTGTLRMSHGNNIGKIKMCKRAENNSTKQCNVFT